MVVFRIWPSLRYETRMLAAFGLILAGLLVQAFTGTFIPGGIVLAAGNLLLLVRGYDNRVDFGRFDPGADWERAGVEKLDELEVLDRKIRAWDRSALDVTCVPGALLFVLAAGLLGVLAYAGAGLLRILALDGMVLLLPHWITGVRSVLVLPALMVKVRTLKGALAVARSALEGHTVNLMILLRGGDSKVPEDVKLRMDIRDCREEFLGLYAQVVINEVQGSSYPYFYVVLVARRGFGLREACAAYRPPAGITAEFKRQDEVEVLVIRQTTTKRSGYHTEPSSVAVIFRQGIDLAERVAAPAEEPAG